MNTELEVARKVKAMTRHEVILKAIEGRLTWTQAADIVRLSPRQVRRLKLRFERDGVHGLRDGRGKPRRGRIPADAVQQILQTISYTWVKFLLQEARLPSGRPGAGSTVGTESGGPCAECCCTSMHRRTSGFRASRRWTSTWCWTMPTAEFSYPFVEHRSLD